MRVLMVFERIQIGQVQLGIDFLDFCYFVFSKVSIK